MKTYYIHNGTEQLGPFDLEQLKSQQITKDTPVWYEGLENWTTVEKIEELRELLKPSTPPPFHPPKVVTPPPIAQPQEKTDSKPVTPQPIPAPVQPKKKAMGKTILLILALMILIPSAIIVGYYVITSIQASSGNGSGSSDYGSQQKELTPQEKERLYPENYLSADATYNTNFWGDKFVIKGSIVNQAQSTTYKDVILEVTQYTKTQSTINTASYILYEFYYPEKSTRFELKVDRYEGAESIGLNVKSATPQ